MSDESIPARLRLALAQVEHLRLEFGTRHHLQLAQEVSPVGRGLGGLDVDQDGPPGAQFNTIYTFCLDFWL